MSEESFKELIEARERRAAEHLLEEAQEAVLGTESGNRHDFQDALFDALGVIMLAIVGTLTPVQALAMSSWWTAHQLARGRKAKRTGDIIGKLLTSMMYEELPDDTLPGHIAAGRSLKWDPILREHMKAYFADVDKAAPSVYRGNTLNDAEFWF